jgi:hypothetical protein
MSVLIDAEIVNVVVLAAVLEADLGSHRAISRFRILRPLAAPAGRPVRKTRKAGLGPASSVTRSGR